MKPEEMKVLVAIIIFVMVVMWLIGLMWSVIL